jgi:hypothetical protein
VNAGIRDRMQRRRYQPRQRLTWKNGVHGYDPALGSQGAYIPTTKRSRLRYCLPTFGGRWTCSRSRPRVLGTRESGIENYSHAGNGSGRPGSITSGPGSFGSGSGGGIGTDGGVRSGSGSGGGSFGSGIDLALVKKRIRDLFRFRGASGAVRSRSARKRRKGFGTLLE